MPSSRPEPPVSSSTSKPDPRKSGARSLPDRGNAGTDLKRKAESQLQRQPKPGNQIPGRTTPKPSTTSTLPKSRQNPPPAAKPASNPGTPSSQKTSAVSSKPPPKGSFADLMAKAKDVQQNARTDVGTLKHQTGPKERFNKTERKKRIMEARTKEKDARSGKRVGATSNVEGATTGKRETEGPSYKGTARPTPTPTPQPGYRGTAGLPSRRDPNDRKAQQSRRSKMDEYLGTDEEDEGDYRDGYDDYYSESSDMEAGLDDVEEEEASTLKTARREDEEEWQSELAAKKEKMERQRKLTSLASRR